jgi:phosphoserine phosphatase RsbU/P
MQQEPRAMPLTVYRGLVEVSCLINSITDYDELLRAILDVARRVMAAEAASIFLLDPSSGDLRLEMDSRGGGSYTRPGIVIPAGMGIAGWVFLNRETLLVPDAYADPRFYREADSHTGFTTRSLLCAPLMAGSRPVGVIEVLNPEGRAAFEEEDVEPFSAYADLTATAIAKLQSLERLREKDRMDRDLAIASEIQADLLARALPPALPGARFDAFTAPSAAVGGDFHGVFPRDDGATDFVIGDVSGKGVPASLLMAQTFSALPFVFDSSPDPSAALASLNRRFAERTVRGMFITMIAGRLIPSTREVLLAAAGHCPPVLVAADGTASRLEVPSAPPVGVLPTTSYTHTARRLADGDRLVLFTDGVTEARRRSGGGFFEALLPGALDGVHTGPGDLVRRLLAAVERHSEGAKPGDDLTILAGGFE